MEASFRLNSVGRLLLAQYCLKLRFLTIALELAFGSIVLKASFWLNITGSFVLAQIVANTSESKSGNGYIVTS